MTTAQKLIKQGRLEGKLEGKLEGMLEGKLEGRLEIAKKMLAKGKPFAEIIDITELSLEQIIQLAAQTGN